MKHLNIIYLSKKIFLICILFMLGCVEDNKTEVIKEYCKESKKPSLVIIYPNPNDTSTYTKIEYYCSNSNICCKYIYKNSVLTDRLFWFENGKQSIEERIVGLRKDSLILKESSQIDTIITTEYIGDIKHWNEKGIVVYETKILSDNTEERIYRDSIGVIIKKDTISW